MSAPVRNRVIVAAIVLAIVALIAFAFAPRPQPVETALVGGGALHEFVQAEGKTRVHDRYVVSAPVAGLLGRVELRENDAVTAGQLLATIDPVPLRTSIDETLARIAEARAQRAGVVTQVPKPAALAQARDRISAAADAVRMATARVVQARAGDAQAQRDRERAAALAGTGDIARDQLEAAQLAAVQRDRDLAAATAQAQQSQAELAAARAALAELEARRFDPDYLYGVYDAQIRSAEATLVRLRHDAAQTEVRSPVTGRVLHVLQQSQDAVAAGAPIIELGNVRALEMVIDVLSQDGVNVRPGAEIRIVGGADRVLRGRVRLVESSAFTKVSALGVEEQRVNVIGDFVDPPGHLGDLYRIETEIDLWSGNDVTQVPIAALVRCGERWCAYVVANGRAQRHVLSIGHENDDAAEVRSGLARGDRVIVHPSDAIADGTRVRPAP